MFEDLIQLPWLILQPVSDDEIQCEWIVKGLTKAKVLHACGYPSCIHTPHQYVAPVKMPGTTLFPYRLWPSS